MNRLPETEQPLVLRTDYSDQAAWEKIVATIQEPVSPYAGMDFYANVDFMDDVSYANLTRKQLFECVPQEYVHSFIIIVDDVAISGQEHLLLIVDLADETHREFRSLLSQIQSIENNLSIGNMGFEEFADAVGDDGVFRGFGNLVLEE